MPKDTEITRLINAKKKAESSGNLKEQAICCNELGVIYSERYLFMEALAEHRQEAQLCEALTDKMGSGIAYRKIGECYQAMERFKEALTYQRKHADVAEEENNYLEMQRAWATIGHTYLIWADSVDAGNLSKAQNAFQKSLNFTESLEGNVSERTFAEIKGRLYLNLGIVMERKKEIQQAKKFLLLAIKLTKEHDLLEDLIKCQFNLAEIYLRQKLFKEALHEVHELCSAARRLGNQGKTMRADGVCLKGQIFLAMGEFQSSKKCLYQAHKMKLPQEMDRRRIDADLTNVVKLCRAEDKVLISSVDNWSERKKIFEKMADLLVQLKSFHLAVEYYQKTLHCGEKLGLSMTALAPIYSSLAQTYTDSDQFSEAVKCYKKLLQAEKGNPKEESRTLVSMGVNMEQLGCNEKDVQQVYHQAIKKAEVGCSVRLQALGLKYLSLFEDQHNMIEAAETKEYLSKLQTKFDLDGVDLEESDPEVEHNSEESDESVDLSELSDISLSDDEETRRQSRTGNKKLAAKRNELGETPLHRAAIMGQKKVAIQLIKQGHPVNPRDNSGWLPLHEACNHGWADVVEVLLDNGAWINDRGGPGCGGVTPLHDAAACGFTHIMELLIERGASLILKTDKGETVLDFLRLRRREVESQISTQELEDCLKLERQIEEALTRVGHINKSDQMTTKKENMRRNAKESWNESSNRSQFHQRPVKQQMGSLDKRRSPEREALSSTKKNSDGNEATPKTKAKMVYKNAILSVGSATTLLRNVENIPSKDKKETKAALLAAEEVGEDWLEDDIGKGKATKRRRLDMFSTMSCKIKKDEERVQVTASAKYKGVPEYEEELPPEELQRVDMYVDKDADMIIGSPGSPTNDDDNVAVSDTDSPIILRRKSTQQLKMDLFCDTAEKKEEAGTLVATPSSLPQQASQVAALKVRVRVLNELLLVPVVDFNDSISGAPLTISWLANETARRYYSLCGVRPVLTLCTTDGATLANDDPISLLVGSEDMLTGRVDTWELEPLPQRYVSACSSLSVPVCRTIKRELSGSAGHLELNDLCMGSAQQLLPLTRALQRQCSLRHLSLRGNKMRDAGLQMLCGALPTLPGLAHLNLECNSITWQGLQHLNDTKIPGLQQLAVLQIGWNFLGDSSALLLARLLKMLPNISFLGLQSSGFTKAFFNLHRQDLTASFIGSGLQKLSLQDNELEETGVEILLKCISGSKIESLSLANCTRREPQILSLAPTAFAVIVELDLSGCGLTELGVSGLRACGNLQYLNIQNNPEVDSWCIIRILQDLPSLEKLNCCGCDSVSNELTSTQSSLVSSLKERLFIQPDIQEMMFSCPTKQLQSEVFQTLENALMSLEKYSVERCYSTAIKISVRS